MSEGASAPVEDRMPMVAQVAISDATVYYDKLYSYIVPAPMEGHIFVGSIVLVPFGRGAARPRIGAVVGVAQEQWPTMRLKELLDVAPAEAALSEELLAMADYLRQTTFCTWFEAIKAVVPAGAQYGAVYKDGGWALERKLRRRMAKFYAPLEKEPGPKTPKQKDVLAFLAGGEKAQEEILSACRVGPGVLKTLERDGFVELRLWEVDADLDAGQLQSAPGRLIVDRDMGGVTALTPRQEEVARALEQSMEQESPRPALLYGVTGSGKTAVFLRLVQAALDRGKTALILVPEIGLTPQMIAQLRAAFGDRVAVQHSALSAGERLAQWKAIKRGEAQVVVGTRSAVFAPLPDIGLIVVDEEQERSYQSEKAPRYNAVELARRRAARHGALLLLASATPLVESYYHAKEGRYDLYELPERYGNQPLPAVEMVDMRQELLAGNTDIISRPLALAVAGAVERREQVVLLLNRRGYHRVGQCRSCGKVLKCGECSVPMIFHRGKKQSAAAVERHRFEERPKPAAETGKVDLSGIRWSGAAADVEAARHAGPSAPQGDDTPGKSNVEDSFGRYDPRDVMMDASASELPEGGHLQCHYCGRREYHVPQYCPECGGPMQYGGFGTQRLEKELEEKFPDARILRMDMDTTGAKGRHASMLSAFGRGEYDILVGTQMVAKGLDFERVSLVGVIGIDSLLAGQGYRAYEQVFSLVTQVVGRAGRAGGQGCAMIQSMEVDNPVLALAAKQDYAAFYESEILFRKMGLYPPFCALCTAGFVAQEEQLAQQAATRFAALLTERAALRPGIPLRVLGPAPMSIVQVAGSYRYRLTLKCRNDGAFRELMAEVLAAYNKEGWPRKAAVYLDFHAEG